MTIQDFCCGPNAALYSLKEGALHQLEAGTEQWLPAAQRRPVWRRLPAQPTGNITKIGASTSGLYALTTDGRLWVYASYVWQEAAPTPEPAAAPPPTPARKPVYSVQASGRSPEFELRKGRYLLEAPCVAAAVEYLSGKTWKNLVVFNDGRFDIPASGSVRVNCGSYSGGFCHIFELP